MTTRSIVGPILLAITLVLGCSGSDRSRRGAATGGGTEDETAPVARGLTMEQMEEIKRLERIGETALVDCYAEEVERTGNKKLEGNVTVKILIGTTGAAQEVQIARSSINAPQMHQCMQQVIMRWEFPRPQAPTWYGTTFNFAPAY